MIKRIIFNKLQLMYFHYLEKQNDVLNFDGIGLNVNDATRDNLVKLFLY